jgi:DNA-binding MarR family transcriptional regulator
MSILKTSSRLLAEVAPLFAEHGISATRFDVLDALSRCPAGARPAELRDLLHLPAQTITGVLDQLEAAGLVRRLRNPGDRRSTLVELTQAGRAVIDRVCPGLIEIEQDCLADLSAAEQRQLIGLLEKVQDRITQRRAVPEGRGPRPGGRHAGIAATGVADDR